MTRTRDVVIAGGGPAGASAAIALTASGRSVLLLEREHFPRPRIGESLPPKIEPLLAALGVADAVSAAGFVRMSGTTVCRGGEILRHDFDPGRRRLGYQVERDRFDRILLDRARAAGAEVLEGTWAARGIFTASDAIGGVIAEGAHAGEYAARITLDATGAAGALARALGARRREALRTAALCGYWRGSAKPADFPEEDTLFEMLPDGWIWSVLRADGLRNVTLGVDAGTLKHRDRPALELYRDRLSGSKLVGPLLTSAVLETELTAHDATWTEAEAYSGPGWLLAGDAASVIDPLTSQGVYKAIQSGLAAAAVINTLLLRPHHRAIALQYYEDTQRALVRSYAAVARSFHRASPHRDQPFWAARIRGEHEPEPAVEEGAARRRALLEAVRVHGGGGVRIFAPDLNVALRPVVEAGFVVERPAFVTPAGDAVLLPPLDPPIDPGLLLPLLDGRTLEALFEAYAGHSGRARASELGRSLLAVLSALAEADLIHTSG